MADSPKQLAVLRTFYYDIALSASPAALPSLLEVADADHITYVDRGNSENRWPEWVNLRRRP